MIRGLKFNQLVEDIDHVFSYGIISKKRFDISKFDEELILSTASR